MQGAPVPSLAGERSCMLVSVAKKKKKEKKERNQQKHLKKE